VSAGAHAAVIHGSESADEQRQEHRARERGAGRRPEFSQIDDEEIGIGGSGRESDQPREPADLHAEEWAEGLARI